MDIAAGGGVDGCVEGGVDGAGGDGADDFTLDNIEYTFEEYMVLIESQVNSCSEADTFCHGTIITIPSEAPSF